ncbi:MAG: ATPase domain-containing protein [Desulfurococcaceae archaeon]
MKGFTTGSSELDKLIGEIPPRTMLLIVGHPGSGKTTLASQICYANAVRGHKCLYMTFYEDREKLFRNMGRLKINLAEVENKGFLTYVKLPVASAEELMDIVVKLVASDHYNVVVIDSINPALELVEREESKRAIVLNFFYQLVDIIDGLLVAVAEMPIGKETLEYGSIEFVADLILYLKHRITRGLRSRILEVRKVRGAPSSVIEVPFAILNDAGFKVYLPPRPERMMRGREHAISTTISFITKLAGPIYKGDTIDISFPPHAREALTIVPLVDIAVTNNLKALLISYKYSPDEVKELFIEVFGSYFNLGKDVVLSILNRHFTIESFNPASYALTHLYAVEVELIEDLKPDMVVHHGTEIFSAVADPSEYWTLLINMLTWLKNNGKLVIRYSARISPQWTRINEILADIVVRIYYKREGGALKPVFYIWRLGRTPLLFDFTNEDITRAALEAQKLAALIKTNSQELNTAGNN